jgi:hypothetical protein
MCGVIVNLRWKSHVRFGPTLRIYGFDVYTPYIYGRPKPMYNHMDTDSVGNFYIRYRVYDVLKYFRMYGLGQPYTCINTCPCTCMHACPRTHSYTRTQHTRTRKQTHFHTPKDTHMDRHLHTHTLERHEQTQVHTNTHTHSSRCSPSTSHAPSPSRCPSVGMSSTHSTVWHQG